MDSRHMAQTQTPFDPNNTKVLHLELTTRCNASCPQCARMDPAYGYSQDHELTLLQCKDKFRKAFVEQLDKMFACGNFGDPAAARDCLAIFDWFRTTNPGMTLGMNTNGGLRTRFWWQELADILRNPLDYVVFSIDGLADTNGTYRRDVIWDHVISNAEYYIAAGGIAHWDMLVFQHNQHQVDACRELARKLGFKRFRTKVSSRFQQRPINFLNPPSGHVQLPAPDGPIRCHAAKERSVYVAATGATMPCCFIGADVFRMSEEMQKYISRPGYTDLVTSWTQSPPSVCKNNCATRDDSTRFLDQWQEDSALC